MGGEYRPQTGGWSMNCTPERGTFAYRRPGPFAYLLIHANLSRVADHCHRGRVRRARRTNDRSKPGRVGE